MWRWTAWAALLCWFLGMLGDSLGTVLGDYYRGTYCCSDKRQIVRGEFGFNPSFSTCFSKTGFVHAVESIDDTQIKDRVGRRSCVSRVPYQCQFSAPFGAVSVCAGKDIAVLDPGPDVEPPLLHNFVQGDRLQVSIRSKEWEARTGHVALSAAFNRLDIVGKVEVRRHTTFIEEFCAEYCNNLHCRRLAAVFPLRNEAIFRDAATRCINNSVNYKFNRGEVWSVFNDERITREFNLLLTRGPKFVGRLPERPVKYAIAMVAREATNPLCVSMNSTRRSANGSSAEPFCFTAVFASSRFSYFST